MRIAIDATPLLLRSAGVKNYLYHWIRALQSRLGSEAISLFPLLRSPDILDHREAHSTIRNRLRLALVHLCNQSQINAMDLWPWKADVFHASPQSRNPPTRRVRLTATVYDMTCWIVPETHEAANIAATRAYADRVLKKADACIAISDSARQDAIQILGMSPDRITTIYPGVADAFYSTDADVDARGAYGLDRPYFLYVGTIEPRKNIDVLLNAYEALPAGVRASCDLALAGLFGWASDATKQRLTSNPAPGVRYLGYVPETALPGLTRRATAVVFPSLYEGFGFPVAQGMAAGTPVITSTGSSLEEVAGGACMLVDPRSTEQLTEAMLTLLHSRDLQTRLSESGRARAELFRWDNVAVQPEAFFRRVAGR